MTSQTKLWALSAGALAMSLALAGCGGGGSSSSTAPSTPTTVAEDPTPPDPAPFMAMVDIGADEQTALLVQLPDQGNSATIMIAAGATVERAGVNFTCESAHPCTITLTNELGTIVASLSTYQAADAADDAMAVAMAVPPPEPPPPADANDPLRELNDGRANAVASILQQAFDANPTDGADNTAGTSDDTPDGVYAGGLNNRLGELGLGMMGAENIDEVTLTSALNPNGTALVKASPPTASTGGSTLTAEDDDVAENADHVAAGEGWAHKVLFRDWGDTQGTDDGGFETGALIYSNMEEPVAHLFDADLADKFVHVSSWFMLTNLAGVDDTAGVDAQNPATSVDIMDATPAGQAAGVVMDADSLVGAQDQDLNVNGTETFTGSYFGARGTFECTEDTDSCAIARRDDGMVTLVDTDTGTAGVQAGEWTFTPDAGERVEVPDQDWIVYGAWLTTPDDPVTGTHRAGVFFNGMDEHGGTGDVFTAAAGLHGMAAYSGSAAGVYVDRTETGLFTADASLTANFDVNGNAASDTGDYTLSGRIDNFKNLAGQYLGLDTADNPNDPNAGGENDWVVLIPSTALAANTGAYNGTPGGSADGVSWAAGGSWNVQLYGPEDAAPTGIAGQFRAITGDLDPDPNAASYKGVAGAFGATKDAAE